MVLPSSRLLRRPARMPTRKRTESSVLPLQGDQALYKWNNHRDLQGPETRCTILEVKMRWFRMKAGEISESLGHD